MSTEFDSLVSLSDWSSKLAELLAASRAAAEQSDEQRLALAQRLTEFIAHSYPATPEIHRLDEIASAAARSLAEHVSNDAAGRIASRSAFLEILAGELEQIRTRTDSAQMPPASSIADLAGKLSEIADDARAIARFRAENPESAEEFGARLARLSGALARLRTAFLPLSSARSEPASVPSGTVIPKGPRELP